MSIARTSCMNNGWKLQDVIDLQDSGLFYGEYESCEYCHHEQIRFVHILHHPNHPNPLRVGCICAERLTNDSITPKKREQALRKRAERRKRWLKRNWIWSQKGNLYLAFTDRETHEKHCVGIMPREDYYKVWIDEDRGTLQYPTQELAQLKIFEVLERRRENNG